MFIAAVFTLILLTNLLVAFAFGYLGAQTGMTFAESVATIPIDSWVTISLGVIGVVIAASAFRYLSIRAGGRAIAEALGGSLIRQSTQDPQQRQLLNIVEEMAIASGAPVPPVYLINEPSINAFAAGFGLDDAVIGINQGTLDLLDRHELQGVVAHEFSHILNGDTSINLRLIAILYGILFLGIIGYGLARAGTFSRKNGLPLLAVGIGLVVIGYGGSFFGNLIKAAVSRQREYLADASAVQYTRDPSGIADALKKIGGHTSGSTMTSAAAEEASHMFFGAAAKKFSGNFMATHPPLEQRIAAIEPNWDGRFLTAGQQPAHPTSAPPTGGSVQSFAGTTTGTSDPTHHHLSSTVLPAGIIAQVGTLNEDGIAVARQLIAEQSSGLAAAAHDPFEARALVYAMLIDAEESIAQQQLALIVSDAEAGVPEHVTRLRPLVSQADHLHLLTLLEMAIPALKELSYEQYKRFTNNTARLITTDAQVEVFEWVLHRLLTKELYPHFEGATSTHGRVSKVSKLADDAATLLSVLAHHGQPDPQAQQRAFSAGAEALGLNLQHQAQNGFDYQHINAALAQLRKLKPLVKPGLLKACVATVMADGKVSSDEGALLQGIAATLDCPLPPSIYYADAN